MQKYYLKRVRNMISLLLMAMIFMFPVSVYAREKTDTTKTGNITLEYPCEGVGFRLYKVGDIEENGHLKPSPEYSSYAFTLDQEKQSDWQTLAETVAAYISRDKLEPIETKKTDQNGTLVFNEKSLGLYLIHWDTHTTAGKRYTSQPFFVAIPSEKEHGEWTYDITAKVKYKVEPAKDETMKRRVHKVWNDNKNAKRKRPKNIEVELLCDGTVQDTIELNEGNSWSYEWSELDANHTWQVTEKNIPDFYTVKITQEGTTFLITNTTKPTNPPTNPPERRSKIPQTGMLWWPVSILASIGLLLLGMGYLLKRKNNS